MWAIAWLQESRLPGSAYIAHFSLGAALCIKLTNHVGGEGIRTLGDQGNHP